MTMIGQHVNTMTPKPKKGIVIAEVGGKYLVKWDNKSKPEWVEKESVNWLGDIKQ